MRMSDERSGWQTRLALPLLALGSSGLYAWLALRYPLFPGLAIGRANWATLGDRSVAAGLAHGAVYSLLVGLYLLVLWSVAWRQEIAPDEPRVLALIWGGWLAFSTLLLGVYPGESLDIFDYLFRGRMLAVYGASPLAGSPTPFADHPFYRMITWRGQVDTYGPLWEYASGGVAWTVGRFLPGPVTETDVALAAYVVGYRLLAILLAGLCGALVYRIARRHGPALAPAALAAWLWNPLLLTASAVGAHNDLLLALWVLAGLWLLQRARWLGGLVALLLAAHVKLTALLLLPVVGFWLIRRIGWRDALARGLLALACALPLSWLLYAPLGGWATLPRMLRERTQFLGYAPADLLYRWLQAQAGWTELAARQLATGSATLLFCALAAGLIVGMLNGRALFRQPSASSAPVADADLWRCSVAVTITYLLVGSFWFMPWYVLWALPLAAPMPTSTAMRRWVPALTLGALWSGLGADTLTFTQAPRLTPTQVSWASVALLLAPLAALALPLGLRRTLRFLRTTAGRRRSGEQP